MRSEDKSVLCFLGGHRAVIGDEVEFEPVRGEGGKLVAVHPRRTCLRRVAITGREQVLAANLVGMVVVTSVSDPTVHVPLLDRYVVAAYREDLRVAICLNKVDFSVSKELEYELSLREACSIKVIRTSVVQGLGIDNLAQFLSNEGGTWALVGHSGVGKTSLIAALCPGQNVGPIAEISKHWGMGRHTTSGSCIFNMPTGGEIVDSPGIRSFVPAGLDPVTVRTHFPMVRGLKCKFRDCLHRPGEQGCVAHKNVDPSLLRSYHKLLEDVTTAQQRRAP